ncbi:hypothetical protein [Methylomonas rapida]|uniref:Uncharacterized protein n=1 Tax=Methylomonas rapida TaxID=2963939 RepID=A0ABY7GQ06_9GAMM|nr:hypothetical protein [Methylomonas rapida]WAR46581.1 hypothetical protein NM686_008715 [Methylomonas rapida]
MPMISLEALLKTVAEQDAEIKELRKQLSHLEALLKNQDKMKIAWELVEFVQDYPGKLHYPIVASTEVH